MLRRERLLLQLGFKILGVFVERVVGFVEQLVEAPHSASNNGTGDTDSDQRGSNS